MMEKHTPGEWQVEADMRSEPLRGHPDQEYLAGWNIVTDSGSVVGCEGIIPGAYAESDAFLMAASKNLLAACQAYVAAYDAGTGTIHVNDQMRAAIAKALPTSEEAGA